MNRVSGFIIVCIAVAALAGSLLFNGGNSSNSPSQGSGSNNLASSPGQASSNPPSMGPPLAPSPMGQANAAPPAMPSMAAPVAAVPANLTDQDVFNKHAEAHQAMVSLQALPQSPALDARRSRIDDTATFGMSREQQQQWGDAYQAYDSVVKQCAALQALAPDVLAADRDHQTADRLHLQGMQLKVPETQASAWADAQAKAAAAGKLYKAGRFRDASAQWQAASASYRAGIAPAAKFEVDRQLRIARSNANDTGAAAARSALRRVLELDPQNAEAAQIQKTIEPFLFYHNSLDMVLALIGPGKYVMGSPNGQWGASEGQMPVTISRGFYLGTTEVTQAQFEAIMGYNPSLTRGPDLPVTNVSWPQANQFCKELSSKEGRTYRLPSEIEWEYACKAGTSDPFSGTGRLDDMGWYADNSNQTIHPVAGKRPNDWGLYDMHGNAAEWCGTLLVPSPRGGLVGMAPRNDNDRAAVRGGGFMSPDVQCRSAQRAAVPAGTTAPVIGFRVLMETN